MNLLLDSHAFLWWREEPKKLSADAYTAIADPQNVVFLSVVTAWELQIKIALNKLAVKGGLSHAIQDEQKTNGFQILPVQLAHALYLENLPPHHQDPFDRLLISQAIVEDMTLVSLDRKIALYPVKLLW
jgi:PIN domain nuclease of toxin-antitoxin system